MDLKMLGRRLEQPVRLTLTFGGFLLLWEFFVYLAEGRQGFM